MSARDRNAWIREVTDPETILNDEEIEARLDMESMDRWGLSWDQAYLEYHNDGIDVVEILDLLALWDLIRESQFPTEIERGRDAN